VPAAGEHALRLVVDGPGGAQAVATATVTRLVAPQLVLDPSPRFSVDGAGRLAGRIEGTCTSAWVEVDGQRTDVAPDALRAGRLEVAFVAPRIARSSVRVVVREDRLGVGSATPPIEWSDLPPPPDGLTLGADGVYVNRRDGSRLRWIWPGSGHLGLEARPEDFLCIAEGAPNPWRAVTIDEGFFLGELEVTRAQVDAFCAARRFPSPPLPGACIDRDGRRTPPTGQHPATRLPWVMAREYCAWAGLRLPTEVEWEWAARGPAALRYPWGPDPQVLEALANTQRGDDAAPASGLAPGGMFPPAPFSGCFDLAGNAWEFVADSPGQDEPHVIRGGSYDHSRVHAHAGFRYRDQVARTGSPNTGLRVARGWHQVGPSRTLPPDPR
jgi:hypothetical protein